MIMRFVLLAGALGLLSSPLHSDAFTIPTTNSMTSMRRKQSAASSSTRLQQFYDANGNPVEMPMVYDANGNLVPFNPAPTQQQQPAAPAQPQQPPANFSPQNSTPPQVNPLTEPPLPPRAKGTDTPRAVGFNSDAYTMSNTADVYLAQLKQDTKIRKIARMSGDLETANTVFGDETVKQIGDSWVDNPYTKEKNRAEARAEIEGTVRMQTIGDGRREVSSGISYKERLAQMQAKRGIGGGAAAAAVVAQAPPQPEVVVAPPVVVTPPPPVQAVATMTAPVVQAPPQPEVVAEVVPPPPVQVIAPVVTQSEPVPVEGTVSSFEAALQAYKESTPENRDAMMAKMREALMAASGTTDTGSEVNGQVASVTPPVVNVAPPPPAQPVMDFPSTYAVAEPEEEAPAAQISPPVAVAPAVPEPKSEPALSIPGTPDELKLQLHTAAMQMDMKTVTTLLDAGLEMNEETTDAAFWAVVNAVDRAEAQDKPLSGAVPQMLHTIFDADLRHLLTREQDRTNVTCMMPEQEGAHRVGMNYIFDDSAHKDLPLEPGRKCEDGTCCDACSRNIFPTFAKDGEADFERFPGINSLTFNELEKVSAATILQFVRLTERVRRTITHEYGLDLKTILPLQAYSRKYVAGTTQTGGGGSEGDHVILHTDEATHGGYHYSCVIYLSTQGVDFEGGDFVFNDPVAKTDQPEEKEEDKPLMSLEDEIRYSGRKLTPFHPTKGAAVIFSSGWENMHEVEKITSGTRYVVPCFFTTCPVPEMAYDQMNVGKPKTDEDIADDWLHLLLAHREESPIEAAGRVKELLMKWHYMCAPLSQH